MVAECFAPEDGGAAGRPIARLGWSLKSTEAPSFPEAFQVSTVLNPWSLHAHQSSCDGRDAGRSPRRAQEAQSRQGQGMPLLPPSLHVLLAGAPSRPLHQREEPKAAGWSARRRGHPEAEAEHHPPAAQGFGESAGRFGEDTDRGIEKAKSRFRGCRVFDPRHSAVTRGRFPGPRCVGEVLPVQHALGGHRGHQ